MILLSFTVRNHKSIKDEITVDLMTPALKTLKPGDDDWTAVTYPLAGIFGGNATGKSAILDAMHYFFACIENSASTWLTRKSMLRRPFLLDGTADTSSSTYELDFVLESDSPTRYRYGFEIDKTGVLDEWLVDVTTRWRTLLDRNRSRERTRFHPSLGGRIEVSDRELTLSRAYYVPGSKLHTIAAGLIDNFDIVLVKEGHRSSRLSDLAEALTEGTVKFSDLQALLQVADIGVEKVHIEERKMPESLGKLLAAMNDEAKTVQPETSGTTAPPSAAEENDTSEDQFDQVIRHLTFTHRGTVKDCPPFSVYEESDGTIAWLALAVPVLETLRSGGLLLVDEIDSSLHPHLIDLVLEAFANPKINSKHAQLIFTSHETYILTRLSEVRLEPEQIWFTDKSYDGATELACLADFPKHPDANIAKRYLTGRYGGTPRLAPSVLASLVASGTA